MNFFRVPVSFVCALLFSFAVADGSTHKTKAQKQKFSHKICNLRAEIPFRVWKPNPYVQKLLSLHVIIFANFSQKP